MNQSLEDKRRKAMVAQKRLIATEAQSKLKEQDNVFSDIVYSGVYGVNKGLAEAAGGLVDFANLAVGSEKPVMGSEWIKDKMGQSGIIGESKYKPVETIGQNIGASIPVFGGLGALSNANKIPQVLQPLTNAFRAAPGLTAMGELSAATSSGVGGAAAEYIAPGNELAKTTGEIAGGFGLTSPLKIGSYAAGHAFRGGKKLLQYFSPSGITRESAKQLKTLMQTSPDDAIKILQQEMDLLTKDLTVAQRVNDPNLDKLEQALEKVSPKYQEFAFNAREKTLANIDNAIESLRSGNPDVAFDFISDRLDAVKQTADEIIDRATVNASKALDNIGNIEDKAVLSKTVRDSIDSAYATARKKESELWEAIDPAIPTKTDNLYKTYQEVKNSLEKTETMPPIIERWLSLKPKDTGILDAKGNPIVGEGEAALKKQERLGAISKFRSELLDEVRGEKSGIPPDQNTIRILNKFQDAALQDMMETSAKDHINIARSFSRELNERFTQGVIGKIRRFDKTGGVKVDPSETLDHIIKHEVTGGVNLDSLSRATLNDPEAFNSAKSYVRKMFVLSAVDSKTGKVNPSAASRFFKTYNDTLQRMPDVRVQLAAADKAQIAADSITKAMDKRVNNVFNKRLSRAALYVNAPINKRVADVLKLQDSPQAMDSLVKITKRDSTGQAFNGLKAAVIDEIWENSFSKTQSGKISFGSRMDNYIVKNKAALSKVLSPDDFKFLGKISEISKRVEGSVVGGKSIEELLDETPDVATDLLARIIGANLGAHTATAKATGVPLVMAGAGSRLARKLTQKIPVSKMRDVITEAMIDKQKMVDLLTRIDGGKNPEKLKRRLNSWLINVVPGINEPEQEKTPTPNPTLNAL